MFYKILSTISCAENFCMEDTTTVANQNDTKRSASEDTLHATEHSFGKSAVYQVNRMRMRRYTGIFHFK